MNIDETISHYNTHGYVVSPGLLTSDELANLRKVTDAVSARAAELEDEDEVFAFDQDADGNRTIQRIKKPNRIDPYYAALARHPRILAIAERLIGANIRLNHSKINMKGANGGAALEWHQDWAFAPHTNMSTCVASVLIDDASAANGAMQVIADSHRGPLLEHHDDEGYFVGAVDPSLVDLERARLLQGAAGTVTFHHPLTLHGSGVNWSGDQRRILFFEYAAADAYPLFYKVDWDEYESRLVAGASTSEVRFEPHYVKLPFPSRSGSSIYKIQADAKTKFFGKGS